MKVVFATPSLAGPSPPFIAALEQSIPLVTGAGWDEGFTQVIGSAYISHARSEMTHRALGAGADVVVYLDYDLSWEPRDLLRLLETPGDVVAGTYRFKQDTVEYMGAPLVDEAGKALRRADGCVLGRMVPAGFLKLTRAAIYRFMHAYPDLMYGDGSNPHIDLFNHGAHVGLWWGEDYAFSRRWGDAGGEIAIAADLDIAHHAFIDGTWRAYPGNFAKFLQGREAAQACAA